MGEDTVAPFCSVCAAWRKGPCGLYRRKWPDPEVPLAGGWSDQAFDL